MPREIISSPDAPPPAGPYSSAVRAGNLVYLSGQTGLDSENKGNVVAQTEKILAGLEGVLKTAGLTLQDVVKTNVYLTDMNDFAAMNGVYARIMGEEFPARTTVAVAALPGGADIEIEMVASAG